jgi:hypothetical protein
MYEFNGWAGETGNLEEIKSALAKPGVVLWQQNRNSSDPKDHEFHELKRKFLRYSVEK